MTDQSHRIPSAALILGLAGVLPFTWGVVTLLSQDMQTLGAGYAGPRFIGPYVQISYGTIILAFMSGVLWGFATKAQGSLAMVGYTLSVIPALWAFFMVGSGPGADAVTLIGGFIALLMLDWFYWRNGLTPQWWLSIRLILTALVILCLVATLVLIS